MILVVCALSAELKFFSARPDVEILAAGIGPIEAASAAARALALGSYAALINVGLGGAFRDVADASGGPGRFRIGDAVLVTQEVLADFGLEGDRPLTLPDGATLTDRVAADERLIAACEDLRLKHGTGLTVTQVTSTDATATRLQKRYGADVESMEGFAVLRAAVLAGVPALELRGISNYVGDRARAEWNFEAGARAAVEALEAVLDRVTSDA